LTSRAFTGEGVQAAVVIVALVVEAMVWNG
jgi:hypothetical protein